MKQAIRWAAATIGLLALAAFAQDGMLMVNQVTTMMAVSNNVSTAVFAAVNPAGLPGAHRVHYSLLSNRGATDIVFDFAATVTTTNLNAGSLTNSVWIGHLLHPDDAYELPADKEYDGPLAAVSTNGTGSGILALTVAYNQN